MEITIEKVDATQAASMLANNENNRSLSKRRVTQLAGAMKRGEWVLNGEAIKFGQDGRLLDGQHRLAALIEADQPQEFVVVRGLESSAQETVDTGAKRSVSDMLAMRGYSHASNLAASARMVWSYDTGNLSGTRRVPTPQQILSVIEESSKAFESAVRKGETWNRHVRGISKAAATAAVFILRRVDAEDADMFVNQVIYGEGLLDGSPALTLRNRLIKEATARPRQRPEYLLAITVKAWNSWRTDRPVHMLRWRPYGDLSESFPMAA